jgi:hypothetical protein
MEDEFMNMPATPPNVELLPLSEQEQRLIKALRLLARILPDAADRVEFHLWTLVGENLKWSYTDPESIKRSMAFAAIDPFLKRESDLITAEFACAEGDGLEGL